MNKKGEIYKTLTGIDLLKFCNDGMLAVREKGKWGFINEKDDIIIPPRYDSCDSYKYGYAKVKTGSKWGIIDKAGKEIITPAYENIYPGGNDVFLFGQTRWGILDITGKIIVPPVLYTITSFEKNRALARLGRTYTILKSPLAK